MNVISMIFGGLIVLQIVAMNMLFSTYTVDYSNKFEEKRLQIAVNYAVDGATKEMKENSTDLGQDYESIARLNVDPSVAFDTFSVIMCKNYGIPCNSTNQQSFMVDYCPVFVVATYDGYYYLSKEKINSSGVENMIFSPKMPYIKEHEENGEKFLYSYNLTLTSALKIDKNGGVYKDYTPPLSRKEQSDLINSTVSDVMNTLLLEQADPNNIRGEFYIPSEFTTIRSTNPITNTTVLAYIDNFDVPNFGTDLQSFGIGGSEIKQKKVVVGFIIEVDGEYEKYYAYSDRLPEGAISIETYDSQEDAAADGYYYYIH